MTDKDSSFRDDDDSSSSSLSEGDDTIPKRLTAAEIIRKKIGKNTEKELKNEQKEKVDIDDEIKRLEAELAEDSSSSSSGSEDDDSDDEMSSDDKRKSKKISFGETVILNQEEQEANEIKLTKESIICASACADEAIAPLPFESLPKCRSKKLKIDFEGNETNNPNSDNTKSRKRKRSKKDGNGDTQKSDGLREAVMEVLQGYVPRSAERIPFYCRVCAHQSSNEEEFFAHKETEFHIAAVEIERKKTYCKLCRKQLTSIVQMQEHLKSRPHREKMDNVKAYQRGEVVGNQDRRNHNHPSGRGGGRGYGRGYGGRTGRGYAGRSCGGRGGRGYPGRGRWHNERR